MTTAGEWDRSIWAERLADYFFPPELAGRPATLAVDEGCLSDLTGLPPQQASEALARVVRLDVMPGHRFAGLLTPVQKWRIDGAVGAPPTLPLLALTVLAASTMTRFDFYRPLRRLLDPEDEGAGVPGDFDEVVPGYWDDLEAWLSVTHQGKRGTPTITRHSHFKYIGVSLQQALLRASDSATIYRFFRAIRLSPDEQVLPAELRRALAYWVAHRADVGPRVTRLATDEAIAPQAEALLQALAESWDGRVRDRTGLKRAEPLRWMLEFRPTSVGLIAKRDPEHPERVHVRDEFLDLELTGQMGYFEPLPLPVDVPTVLDNGIELAGETLTFVADKEEAISFARDETLNEWVSSPTIQYGEIHHLLVRSHLRSETAAWIAAVGGEATLDPLSTPRLPPGWFLFKGLRLLRRPTAPAPPAIAALLRESGGGTRVRLVGGLRVRGLGRTYLTGGVPNVAVPTTGEDFSFEIRHEGHPAIVRNAESGEFLLSAFDLGPGEYEIAHSTSVISFSIVDGVFDHPRSEVGSVATESIDGPVRGQLTPSPIAPPRACAAPPPGTPLRVLIGSSSTDVELVRIPLWLQGVTGGPLSWTHIDAWQGFDPVWALDATPGGGFVAHLLDPVPPASSGADTAWSRLIRQATFHSDDPDVARLWADYLHAAGTP